MIPFYAKHLQVASFQGRKDRKMRADLCAYIELRQYFPGVSLCKVQGFGKFAFGPNIKGGTP